MYKCKCITITKGGGPLFRKLQKISGLNFSAWLIGIKIRAKGIPDNGLLPYKNNDRLTKYNLYRSCRDTRIIIIYSNHINRFPNNVYIQ